jgi:acetamidase/formamidase
MPLISGIYRDDAKLGICDPFPGEPNWNCQLHRTIHRDHHHYGWDNRIAPVVSVAPGDTIEVEMLDASNGRMTPRATLEDVVNYDFDHVNPVTGPIFVDGAQPGDVVKVTVLAFDPSGWGWTANIPGFGLLADQFRDPALHLWKYDPAERTPAMFGARARVPIRPFLGTIGLAPAAIGRHSIVPPRRVGGNMDIRDIGAGTELYLPVEVPGALLSVGDPHAAQGDGEVCGAAIEGPMNATIKIDLIKATKLPFPRFTLNGPRGRPGEALGYEVTTGIGPDILQAARDAVAGMVDLLSTREGMPPIDAYMLCSSCADLALSEVVDLPNYVVSFYFPLAVLE